VLFYIPELGADLRLAIRLACAFSKIALMSDKSKAHFDASLFSPEQLYCVFATVF
jgi:hypothetical protein